MQPQLSVGHSNGQRCGRSYAVHEQAEAVFRYGDEGDLFYIILSGSVRANSRYW
jgi:hypothetical protein